MPKLSRPRRAFAALLTLRRSARAGRRRQAGGSGAFATGHYRNLFAEADPRIGEAEIGARLDAYWDSLFGTDPGSARLLSVGAECERADRLYPRHLQ